MTHQHSNRGDFFSSSGSNDFFNPNQGGLQHSFFDFFKPFGQPGQGPFDGGGRTGHQQPFDWTGRAPHHQPHDATGRAHHQPYEAAGHTQHPAHPAHHGHQYGNHGAESARPHLPDLSITDNGASHHKTKAQPSRDAAEKTDQKPDTGLGSWGPHSSSSAAIAQAAADSVGQHTYLPRPGSPYYGQHLPASLGCTSASTNMFFDGLHAAGKLSDKDYKRVHQVGNDQAYVSLQHQGIAKPVNGHDLKPGDWAYFKNPGAQHGHSGVVFEDAKGNLMVANNRSGTTIATPLSTLMHHYQTVRGLRANI